MPERGHDMSAAGKFVLAAILAKGGAVLFGIRSLAFVMRDPFHTHPRGGGGGRCCPHCIFPRRLYELPPPGFHAAFLSPDQRGEAEGEISLGSSSRPGTDPCLVFVCRFVVFEVRPVLYRDGDEPQK